MILTNYELETSAVVIDTTDFTVVKYLNSFNTETKEAEFIIYKQKSRLRHHTVSSEVLSKIFNSQRDKFESTTGIIIWESPLRDEKGEYITGKYILKDCIAYNRETGEEII